MEHRKRLRSILSSSDSHMHVQWPSMEWQWLWVCQSNTYMVIANPVLWSYSTHIQGGRIKPWTGLWPCRWPLSGTTATATLCAHNTQCIPNWWLQQIISHKLILQQPYNSNASDSCNVTARLGWTTIPTLDTKVMLVYLEGEWEMYSITRNKRHTQHTHPFPVKWQKMN
jgi:hypothetical protein